MCDYVPDFRNQVEYEEKLLKVLMEIISVNNDTNVLYRSDRSKLKELQNLAQNYINCNDVPEKDRRLKIVHDFCQKEHISPGGSADMLAVSLFFYEICSINL